MLVADIPVLNTGHVVDNVEKLVPVAGYGRHSSDLVYVSEGDCMDPFVEPFNATNNGFYITLPYREEEGAVNTYNVCYQLNRERRIELGTLSVVKMMDIYVVGLIIQVIL